MLASFWSSFWPDFAATILGVAAGIPIGLWLDRRAERSAIRARAQEFRQAEERRILEEKTRSAEALEQLAPVIRGHVSWFAVLGAWGNLNEYHEGPLNDLWVVLRNEIVPTHLSDR